MEKSNARAWPLSHDPFLIDHWGRLPLPLYCETPCEVGSSYKTCPHILQCRACGSCPSCPHSLHRRVSIGTFAMVRFSSAVTMPVATARMANPDDYEMARTDHEQVDVCRQNGKQIDDSEEAENVTSPPPYHPDPDDRWIKQKPYRRRPGIG